MVVNIIRLSMLLLLILRSLNVNIVTLNSIYLLYVITLFKSNYTNVFENLSLYFNKRTDTIQGKSRIY